MRLFSRDKETVPAAPPDDVPFESLRRSPRNQRGKRGPLAASGPDFEPGAPLDPAQATKARARRRLIGAIAIALAAIVFVPMLFDRAPVAPPGDIGLQIPDRDTPFEGRRGVPDPARGPLKPSGELPSTPPPAVVDTTPAPEPATPAETGAEPAPKPAASSKAPEKPAAKVADKPKAPEPASTDDPRAVAALEGRAEASAPPDAAANRSFAVQIAAFSAPDKAKGLRDQLVANGLRSYTESVSTPQGLRTRVRLGPFPTREAADKAKQKLKTMKLDGSVVPL